MARDHEARLILLEERAAVLAEKVEEILQLALKSEREFLKALTGDAHTPSLVSRVAALEKLIVNLKWILSVALAAAVTAFTKRYF